MARTATEGLVLDASERCAPRPPHLDRVMMTMPTASRPSSTGGRARPVREAVRTAATSGVRVVETVVDGSTPAGGSVLAALRELLGTEVDTMTMRRAGSSVFVTLELAAPPPSRTASCTVASPGLRSRGHVHRT